MQVGAFYPGFRPPAAGKLRSSTRGYPYYTPPGHLQMQFQSNSDSADAGLPARGGNGSAPTTAAYLMNVHQQRCWIILDLNSVHRVHPVKKTPGKPFA
jgi:hypothetical protein